MIFIVYYTKLVWMEFLRLGIEMTASRKSTRDFGPSYSAHWHKLNMHKSNRD